MMLVLLATAFAQDEVCSTIYTANEFDTSMGEAEGLLEKGDIDRALGVVDKTLSLVRCSETLVDSAQLERFAELSAQVHFFSQDAEQALAWVRQLTLIAPEHDWGEIAEDHPLRELLAESEMPEPNVPEGMGYAVPKGGSVFIDGAFSPSPSAVPEVPHLVQTFGPKGHLIKGFWQDGGAFRDGMLVKAEGALPKPKYYNASTGEITPKGKPPSDVSRPKRSPPSPLIFAGAGLVVASGVLYTFAGLSKAKFNCEGGTEGCDTRMETLTKRRTTTNLLMLGSGITFVAGVGLGVTGVLATDGGEVQLNGRF